MRDGRLRQAIDQLGRERDEAGLRAHVDDAAAARGLHVLHHPLADEEGRLDVEVDRQVEVGLGHVLRQRLDAAADIVDENVDPAEFGDRLVDRGVGLVQLQRVHLERQRPPPHRPISEARPASAAGIAEPEGDVGAGIGERKRDGAAETAGSAGDEGGLAAEIEAGQFRHDVFLPILAATAPHAGHSVSPGNAYNII